MAEKGEVPEPVGRSVRLVAALATRLEVISLEQLVPRTCRSGSSSGLCWGVVPARAHQNCFRCDPDAFLRELDGNLTESRFPVSFSEWFAALRDFSNWNDPDSITDPCQPFF